MALLRTIHCNVCDQDKQVWFDPNDGPPKVCTDCGANRAAKEKKETLDKWSQQPTEDRLKRIEEVLYDMGTRS